MWNWDMPFIKRMKRLVLVGVLLCPVGVSAEEGVTANEIRLGTVLDLEGSSKGLGQGMLTGVQAAFKDKSVAGKQLVLAAENDFYTPERAVEATQKLLGTGVLAFVGNVGTPTARVTLPILEEKKIPAIGFFSGSGLLRPGSGDIVNFRASYVQEVAAVVQEALAKGIDPAGVCAFVQNDAYGMSGVQGLQLALEGKPGVEALLEGLKKIVDVPGENATRNKLGPVGFYVRNTFVVRDAYDSLKAWEAKTGKPCRLIVTVGVYEAVGRFIAYAMLKKEPWIYSAVSFTGADDLLKTLKAFNVNDRVIMTHVVPLLDSSLPIVSEARTALGDKLGYVSLEGYIVGRLLLHGLTEVGAAGKEITRGNMLDALRGKQFDLGGLSMDFRNDNQGSDFVVMTALSDNRWVSMDSTTWRGWYE